jgi:hypothetical protein
MQGLSVGNAGWVRCETNTVVAYVRLAPDDRGRWVVREMVLDASEGDPITQRTLTQIPLTRVESYCNTHAPTRESLAARRDVVSPVGGPVSGSNVAVLASHFATIYGTRTDPAQNWAATAQASTVTGTTGRLAKRAAPKPQDVDVSYRLDSGPTEGLTDAFLANVGRAYAAAVARGESPSRAMAADVSVSHRTAEWWVRVARLRGIMPPTRKGSRG